MSMTVDRENALALLAASNGNAVLALKLRAEVARLYPGLGWKQKVAHMPDGQILAIYNRQCLGKGTGGGGNGR